MFQTQLMVLMISTFIVFFLYLISKFEKISLYLCNMNHNSGETLELVKEIVKKKR